MLGDADDDGGFAFGMGLGGVDGAGGCQVGGFLLHLGGWFDPGRALHVDIANLEL